MRHWSFSFTFSLLQANSNILVHEKSSFDLTLLHVGFKPSLTPRSDVKTNFISEPSIQLAEKSIGALKSCTGWKFWLYDRWDNVFWEYEESGIWEYWAALQADLPRSWDHEANIISDDADADADLDENAVDVGIERNAVDAGVDTNAADAK